MLYYFRNNDHTDSITQHLAYNSTSKCIYIKQDYLTEHVQKLSNAIIIQICHFFYPFFENSIVGSHCDSFFLILLSIISFASVYYCRIIDGSPYISII